MYKMTMKLYFVTTVVIVLTMTITDSEGNLVYLGTTFRKSFYADWVNRKNWTDAGAYCRSAGMQLATIRTADEQGLLLSRASNGSFRGGFWTAGRDAHRHNQFVWDLDGETVTPFGVRRFYVSIPYQSCLLYGVNANINRYDEFQPRPCSQNFWGTLCEII